MIRTLSDYSGRSVAVTGATGFVGQHLAKRLVQLGSHVTALTRADSRTCLLYTSPSPRDS